MEVSPIERLAIFCNEVMKDTCCEIKEEQGIAFIKFNNGYSINFSINNFNKDNFKKEINHRLEDIDYLSQYYTDLSMRLRVLSVLDIFTSLEDGKRELGLIE